MNDFDKNLKELTEGHLKALVNEIYEYFNMLPKIYDDKIRNRLEIYKGTILKQFSLTPKKLKDPLYFPEILKLAFYIIENNRKFFKHDWNTQGYYHHDRNDVILNLTEHLEPISKKIKKMRLEKLEQSIGELKKVTSDLILAEEDKYISISFSEYDLPHYDEYLSLINNSALFNDFYKLIPSQLRCLFENLLYDIFSKSLHKDHRDLYFSRDQRKARNFVKLIDLLDFLKELEFKEYLREKITKDTISTLEEIREKGNFTVHDIMDKVTRKFINDWKEEINLILKPLLVCYKDLKGKDIRLEKSREMKIKKKWGMIKDKKTKVEISTIEKNENIENIESKENHDDIHVLLLKRLDLKHNMDNEIGKHDLDIKFSIIPINFLGKNKFEINEKGKNLILECNPSRIIKDNIALFQNFNFEAGQDYLILKPNNLNKGTSLLINMEGSLVFNIRIENPIIKRVTPHKVKILDNLGPEKKEYPLEKIIILLYGLLNFLCVYYYKLNYNGKLNIGRHIISYLGDYWVYKDKNFKVKFLNPEFIEIELDDLNDNDIKLKLIHKLINPIIKGFGCIDPIVYKIFSRIE